MAIFNGPLQAPDVESFINDMFGGPHADDLRDLQVITPHEGAEILSDQIGLIHQDIRTNKGKIFSQGQVERLDKRERLLQLEQYRQVTFTSNTHGYDSSPFQRLLFYTNRWKKRKGFYADNMIKCTMLRRPGVTDYVVVLDSDWGLIHFAFTGHFFDRLALRKDLDVGRSESVYDVMQEYSRGFLAHDRGFSNSGEVLIYTNEGISLGQGVSLLSHPDRGTVTKHEFSFEPANQKVFRFVFLKTFVTNEMAHAGQVEFAEQAQRVRIVPYRVNDYVDRMQVEAFFRAHHEKLRK